MILKRDYTKGTKLHLVYINKPKAINLLDSVPFYRSLSTYEKNKKSLQRKNKKALHRRKNVTEKKKSVTEKKKKKLLQDQTKKVLCFYRNNG